MGKYANIFGQISQLQQMPKVDPFVVQTLNYGLDGIIHAFLMKEALEINRRQAPVSDLIEKYGITLSSQIEGDLKANGEITKLVTSISKIKENTDFLIPETISVGDLTYFIGDRQVVLFNEDYGNIFMSNMPLFKIYNRSLMNKSWNFNDLEDTDLLVEGMAFGEDLSHTTVQNYNALLKINRIDEILVK